VEVSGVGIPKKCRFQKVKSVAGESNSARRGLSPRHRPVATGGTIPRQLALQL
jgi:hypothetical protein